MSSSAGHQQTASAIDATAAHMTVGPAGPSKWDALKFGLLEIGGIAIVVSMLTTRAGLDGYITPKEMVLYLVAFCGAPGALDTRDRITWLLLAYYRSQRSRPEWASHGSRGFSSHLSSVRLTSWNQRFLGSRFRLSG